MRRPRPVQSWGQLLGPGVVGVLAVRDRLDERAGVGQHRGVAGVVELLERPQPRVQTERGAPKKEINRK